MCICACYRGIVLDHVLPAPPSCCTNPKTRRHMASPRTQPLRGCTLGKAANIRHIRAFLKVLTLTDGMKWKHLWLKAQCEWNLTAQSHGQRWENAAINTDPTEIWRCVIKASENVLLSRQRTWDWFFSQVRFFVKYWPDWHLFFVQYHDQTWWRLFIMYYIFHKLSSS